jgi:hypothetical protein
MPGRKMLSPGVFLLTFFVAECRAGHHGSHGDGQHGGGNSGVSRGFGGGLGFGIGYGYSYYGAVGADGWMPNVNPFFNMGPFGFMPPPQFAPMNFQQQPRGPLLPPPPRDNMGGQPVRAPVRPVKAGNADPARSAQLMTFGDRLFRAGNLKKAEERYQQALKAGSHLAAPYVRLAQLSLVRGNYAEAAERFREAESAQPGWLVTAPDIQPLYGEPTEFARQISRIESHVQAHPQDRNAWLVLGAEWFLSGRTAKAADVFQRLDDPNRRADVALSAFLDASAANRARRGEPAPADGERQDR